MIWRVVGRAAGKDDISVHETNARLFFCMLPCDMADTVLRDGLRGVKTERGRGVDDWA